MNNMRNKILSLLVLLVTAASGAWAETFTTFQEGDIIKVGDKIHVDYWMVNNLYYLTPTDTYTLVRANIDDQNNITEAADGAYYVLLFEIAGAPFYKDFGKSFLATANSEGLEVTAVDTSADPKTLTLAVFGGPAEAPIEVEWNASTKTGTFSMPGSDVVLTPQYAPAAKWDVVENVEQLPAALEGIIAGQDAAIVTPGQSAQGTVMYAVTPTAEAAPALTAFSATVPNAKDYDDATTVYVWYYIQGQDTPDGQQATEENTFNDSEISATPLKVDILTNKFDLTLSPAPVKNMTVTVAGQAKTPTDEGKVEAVKMQSEVKLKAATGYKFRKVEVKKGVKPVTLATALENGAVVKIDYTWDGGATSFTFTNNNGNYSCNITGTEAEYFASSLTIDGSKLVFQAHNIDVDDANVRIQFYPSDDAFYIASKGSFYTSFTISVNGTDIKSQLEEWK